ncbi:MAG TPA: hypothetical protein VLI54_05500 [Bacillota bacterium]|nr:hypothetical protein [Bacillota bacterium]
MIRGICIITCIITGEHFPNHNITRIGCGLKTLQLLIRRKSQRQLGTR